MGEPVRGRDENCVYPDDAVQLIKDSSGRRVLNRARGDGPCTHN